MGIGSFFHYIGTFFLFAAFILLLIPSISSPVISGLAILKVDYGQGDFTFGSWGYCRRQDGALDCTKKMIGYNPAEVLRPYDNSIDISGAGENTSKGLTRVMVLHPVGCVLAFIAFLLSLGKGTMLSFLASLISGLALIITVVVVATDFAGMSIIHHDANDSNNLSASYGSAIWCVVGAIIALFIGTVLVFLTCCSSRRKNRTHHGEEKMATSSGRRRLGFGRRKVVAV